MHRSGLPVAALLAGWFVSPASAQWANFVEDPSRLSAPPALGAADVEEKDFAFGDLDLDGDLDLVVVRKEPFTSTGRRTNVLLMNENGVLVDRTGDYATASDVAGDNGFETPTNDRDVVLVDLDLDGWLDLVTAVTLTDNEAKHLSHPRVYMNLGEKGGLWQGFQHQDARIPQMHPTAGPRFCSVAAGDVTGDGYPDLYFGDYDSGGPQIFDFNNRLLINDGTGVFTDETASRLTAQMTDSAFGAASVIADINGDGVNDVVKQTSLNSPLHVAVTYNDPLNVGVFDRYDLVNEAAPYFVSVGDLNSDGLLDLVVTDDGSDRYHLNQGNDGLGQSSFSNMIFSNSGGFGGNSVIADLNNDGHNDVVITDVDVDIAGCSRTTFIYRNMGDLPAVTFQKQGEPIPDSELSGVHDAAIFDLDGDGWLDVVLGRCLGTRIWMNQPPVGLVFSFPGGLPGFLTTDETTPIQMQLSAFGGGQPVPNTGRIHVSMEGGPFVASDMTALGGDLYSTDLPAMPCAAKVSYYFEAESDTAGVFKDPADAPATVYTAVAAAGLDEMLREEFETGAPGWTVLSDGPVSSGDWEIADPEGTVFNAEVAAPGADATQGAESTMAFVTENGAPGGAAADSDVDGGPTVLMSPAIDLAGTDAIITFARWFFSKGGETHVQDFMETHISGDGGTTWTAVSALTTSGTGGEWETASFVVSDYIVPTADMRVRFSVGDQPNNSVTEGGIDNFQVDVFLCEAPVTCPGDFDGDGEVEVPDLVRMITEWGLCPAKGDCDTDLNQDGETDVLDLVQLIVLWGECP